MANQLADIQSMLVRNGYQVQRDHEQLKVKIGGSFISAKIRVFNHQLRIIHSSYLELVISNFILFLGLTRFGEGNVFNGAVLIMIAVTSYVQVIIGEVKITDLRRQVSSVNSQG